MLTTHLCKVNVNFTLGQATKAQRGSRGMALLYAKHPGKETRYPLYRRLGGPKGQSRRVRKISPPPGFDLRTAQPIASRYTD